MNEDMEVAFQLMGVVCELDTRVPDAPDTYRIDGLCISDMHALKMVLRHEHRRDSEDVVYLFGMEPDPDRHQPQVFIHAYSLPEGLPEYSEQQRFYEEQRKGFRLEGDTRFTEDFLSPGKVIGFEEHRAFQTRDGRTRRRIVHDYRGERKALLLVYSLDSANFVSDNSLVKVPSCLAIYDESGTG